MKGRGRIRPLFRPRWFSMTRTSGDPGSLSPRCRTRQRFQKCRGWHIYDVLSSNASRCNVQYFREKSTKMHEMEHRTILTESIPKVAPIELPDTAFESGDIGEQNSQRHGVSTSLAYVSSGTKLEKYDTKIQARRSCRDPRKLRRDAEEDTSETASGAVFQGLQFTYCRFPSNQSVCMKLFQEFRKKLEKSFFSVCTAFCRTCHQQETFSTEGSTEPYSMQFFALYNRHSMPDLRFPAQKFSLTKDWGKHRFVCIRPSESGALIDT